MDKNLKVAVILSAVDKMTRVVDQAVGGSIKKLNDFQKQADAVSKSAFGFAKDAAGIGAAAAATLALPTKSFMDLEEAQTRLQSVMLEAGGVLNKGLFDKVSKEATRLGDKLPGTTADFFNMFETLINGGVAAQSILDGVGESAAYLAIATKMPYEEAALSAAKLKTATGVADNQMKSFMDTIARMKQFNVSASEMQYAFGRSAGALKTLGVQGLEASKSMSTVYAMLIQGGLSGETVGTGMTAIMNSFYDQKKMSEFNRVAADMGLQFDFIDEKTKKFKGVENMVAQFDKMKGLNAQQISDLVSALTGGGGDANMVKMLVDQGITGFNKYQNAMQKQATLDQKVGLQTKTIAAQWEAATGTFQNSMAKVGEKLKPVLIDLIGKLNKLSEWISGFVEKHPRLTAMLVGGVAGFAGLAIAASGVGFIIGGVAKTVSMVSTAFQYAGKAIQFGSTAFKILGNVVSVVSKIMMANPIILIIMAIAAAAYLIYKYWEPIKAFFVELWGSIKRTFKQFWDWVMSLPIMKPVKWIIDNWGKIKAAFAAIWDNVKSTFMNFMNWMLGIPKRMYDAGVNIVKSIWEGIKSFVSKPIDAIKNMVGKIREYLPFSPAKVGPLRDIHRIKLVETIADSVKPAPLVKAMRTTTAAAMIAATPVGIKSAGAMNAGRGASAVNVTYSPSITIQGGSATAKEDFKKLLNEHQKEIAKVVDEVARKNSRTKF